MYFLQRRVPQTPGPSSSGRGHGQCQGQGSVPRGGLPPSLVNIGRLMNETMNTIVLSDSDDDCDTQENGASKGQSQSQANTYAKEQGEFLTLLNVKDKDALTPNTLSKMINISIPSSYLTDGEDDDEEEQDINTQVNTRVNAKTSINAKDANSQESSENSLLRETKCLIFSKTQPQRQDNENPNFLTSTPLPSGKRRAPSGPLPSPLIPSPPKRTRMGMNTLPSYWKNVFKKSVAPPVPDNSSPVLVTKLRKEVKRLRRNEVKLTAQIENKDKKIQSLDNEKILLSYGIDAEKEKRNGIEDPMSLLYLSKQVENTFATPIIVKGIPVEKKDEEKEKKEEDVVFKPIPKNSTLPEISDKLWVKLGYGCTLTTSKKEKMGKKLKKGVKLGPHQHLNFNRQL